MADKLRKMKDRASRLYSEGKLEEALEMYRAVLELDPASLTHRIKTGDVLRKLGRRKEAIEAYEQVARRYAEDGLLLKAIAVCKVLLTVDPAHNATQTMLADLYARRRSGNQAEVPSLPVAEAPAQAVTPGVEGADTAWPSGVRVIELDPEAAEAPPPAFMAAWPVSQPVEAGPPRGGTVPIVTGRAEDDIEIEVAEIVVEVDEPIELPTGPAMAPAGEPAAPETFDVEVEPGEVGGAVVETPAATGHSAPPLIPLFSDLPKKAFVDILVRMKMLELRRGEIVIREGENGDAFYIVASGILLVTRRDAHGVEVPLARLGEGAFFGEMALLRDGARTATVKVVDDAQVFEVSRELLEELIEQYPTVASAVKNFYRQRLLASAMATHPLFAAYPADQRRELMAEFKSRSFAPGEVILQQGKKGNGLYVLLHGKVEVTRSEKGVDEPIPLAELGSGDIFGEMSLLTGNPTNATVTALEDAFVLRLSKKRFDELMLGTGPVIELIGRLEAERSAANQRILGQQLEARGAVVV